MEKEEEKHIQQVEEEKTSTEIEGAGEKKKKKKNKNKKKEEEEEEDTGGLSPNLELKIAMEELGFDPKSPDFSEEKMIAKFKELS